MKTRKKIIVFRNILPFGLWHLLNNFKNELFASQLKSRWVEKGSSLPPPHYVKQLKILEYKKKYNLQVFVETGTYLGDMVAAMAGKFQKINSIELGKDLYQKAMYNFRNQSHISIMWGDSGERLKEVIGVLNEPALFWLDAHYSSGITAKGEKESPIYEELQSIFTQTINHVILIDDAHCFNGNEDYPALQDLISNIQLTRPNYQVTVENNIICVLPPL